MMDFWTPTTGSWAADFDDAHMPWYVHYDYVKVEKYNQRTGEFELHWRDDFDCFDEKRWLKSNGWPTQDPSNSTTYYPSQVYTANGALVLKMVPKADTATDALEIQMDKPSDTCPDEAITQ